MASEIEKICIEKGMRMTDQRRVIARVLSDALDHPDVEEVYRRSIDIDSRISIATVYRTVRLFEEAGILERHDFRVENGENRARFELVSEIHHDHLIDVECGEVIEFHDDEIELLQKKIAEKYGYKLVDHRMELYGVKIK
ncbi:MAG: transcriptional repressor [Emcibacter sp.]|nr:transcriptional repressor [Emcibacter sp.]